ncbi:MAG: glycoside hydrolase family 28 protein [Phycisphaerae bacterium]
MNQNIADFGAVGDGRAMDTEAIQQAIDTCNQTGGGRVTVGPGTYLCGTILVKSNVELHLQMGARILGTDDMDAYLPIAKQRGDVAKGHIYGLVCAQGAENIAITGPGTIDGGGVEAPPWQEAKAMKVRPGVVFCVDCANVRIYDVSMLNTRMWTCHLLRCDYVAIRGITIRCNPEMANSDGIDPNGCRDVTISDSVIESGDDAICIKSTDGDRCENITVNNCILSTTCAALKLGTESFGTIRNVSFNNCIVRESNIGLAAYMKDGGTFENITFSNVMMDVYGAFPIILDITPRFYDEPTIGAVRNVSFDNVTVTGPGRCLIEGSAESPVENVSFRNVTWIVTGPCNAAGSDKPAGAARVRLDPDRENYATRRAQFIAAWADGLVFRDIRINYVDTPIDRGGIWAEKSQSILAENILAPLAGGFEAVKQL